MQPFEAIKHTVTSRGWRWRPGKAVPYGEQIVVSDGQHQATVNYYPRRGKVVVGGPESPLKAALLDATASESATDAAPPAITVPHIGMDESGKGDWFGPLIVAAVYADSATLERLRQMGVRDSKQLEAGRVRHLAEEIAHLLPPEHYHVEIVAPTQYNQAYQRHGNINALLAECYGQVAERVWSAVPVGMIVCDQFSQRTSRLEHTFTAHGLPRPLQQPHAESASLAVAAASLLATARFAAELERLGQVAGLGGRLPAGASDVARLRAAARRIVARHGKAALGNYAKLHFKPVQELLGA